MTEILVSGRVAREFGTRIPRLDGSLEIRVVDPQEGIEPEPTRPRVLFKTGEISESDVGWILAKYPSIEWVHVSSAGLDAVLPYLSGFCGVVSNGAGAHADAIAEWAAAMMLWHTRDAGRIREDVRQQRWNTEACADLAGATLGVVGAGATGRAVAARSVAFGMDVLGLRRSGEPLPNFSEMYVPAQLERVLERSHFVLVSAPLTAETRGMFGAREFAVMRDDAALLNTARGGLVDTSALVEALTAGELGAAYLDVTDPEPLPPGHPLWSAGNVLVTGHSSWRTTGARERIFRLFADNLVRWLQGRELVNVVDRARDY